MNEPRVTVPTLSEWLVHFRKLGSSRASFSGAGHQPSSIDVHSTGITPASEGEPLSLSVRWAFP